MPRLIRLEEDGPLGPAGTQVWVNDDPEAAEKPKPPRKSAPSKRKHDES